MHISAIRSSGKTAGSNAAAVICAEHLLAAGHGSVGYPSMGLGMWQADFSADCRGDSAQALFGAADENRLLPTSEKMTRTM